MPRTGSIAVAHGALRRNARVALILAWLGGVLGERAVDEGEGRR